MILTEINEKQITIKLPSEFVYVCVSDLPGPE